MMEFAEDINGYGVKFDPETGKISYSIGGRVFKTLSVFYRFSTNAEPSIRITDGKDFNIEFQQSDYSELNINRIMKAACNYAGKL